MATAPEVQGRTARVVVRSLRRRDRDAAIARLRDRARDDLFLLDLVRQIGAGATAEVAAEVLGAWRGTNLVGVASLRPTLVLESQIERPVLEALLGPLSDLGSGLVRSEVGATAALWERLAARGRRALVDRRETSLVLEHAELRVTSPPRGVAIRAAGPADLEPLVEAARASLREEGRPDPFIGDPRGFRRWVAARLPRALLAEHSGEVVWVGYADVRLDEGWLLQGVYTWPAWRRRGLAAAGVTALCQVACAAGAEHVQLSVVEGNIPAHSLYEHLGFRPHIILRTLLFI
jgi:predicted GNAT family acetyltransferase